MITDSISYRLFIDYNGLFRNLSKRWVTFENIQKEILYGYQNTNLYPPTQVIASTNQIIEAFRNVLNVRQYYQEHTQTAGGLFQHFHAFLRSIIILRRKCMNPRIFVELELKLQNTADQRILKVSLILKHLKGLVSTRNLHTRPNDVLNPIKAF